MLKKKISQAEGKLYQPKLLMQNTEGRPPEMVVAQIIIKDIFHIFSVS